MRDNQPKHRQLRQLDRKLQRAKASRQGLPRFLIVCEGQETEPNYLMGLLAAYRINGANAVILRGEGRTDSINLVKRARDRFKIDPDFDRVFVVCDHEHAGIPTARALAAKAMRNAAAQAVTVELVLSRPCFEFWLLLHFEYTARVFRDAADVTRALQGHLPDYHKADRQIFAKVRNGVAIAVERGDRVQAELAASGATTPGSDLPVLITALLALSSQATRSPS